MTSDVGQRWVVFELRLLLVAACVVALCGCPGAQDEARSTSAPAPGGLRAVVDPASGELTADPGVGLESLRVQFREEGFSTSDAGLYEEEMADGTIMLDPQGRFRSGLQVTVSDDAEGASAGER